MGCHPSSKRKYQESWKDLVSFKDCTRHLSKDSREVLGQRIHCSEIPELLTCILELTQVFEQLYNFFSASTYRWKVLTDHLPRNVPVTKTLSNTRWSERADATAAVAKGFKFIQSALLSLQQDEHQT